MPIALLLEFKMPFVGICFDTSSLLGVHHVGLELLLGHRYFFLLEVLFFFQETLAGPVFRFFAALHWALVGLQAG